MMTHWFDVRMAIDWFLGFSFAYNTFIYIPQSIRLLREKKSEELSFLMFFFFDVAFLIQLAYMFFIAHDDEFVLGTLFVFASCLAVTYLIAFYNIKALFLKKDTSQNGTNFLMGLLSNMLYQLDWWKKCLLGIVGWWVLSIIYFYVRQNILLLKSILSISFNMVFILVALSFIVQLSHLVQRKRAKQLALTTFIGFNIVQIVTAFYAYFHGIQALLMGMLLYLATSLPLTILIIYYKFRNREF